MPAPPASTCPIELRPRYTAEPFLTDRMADALVAADLVVGRAGSSTCAELTAAGVASILVPYPYAGAHQRYNARVPRPTQGAAIGRRRRGARRRPAAWPRSSALRDDGRRDADGRGRETPRPAGRRERAGRTSCWRSADARARCRRRPRRERRCRRRDRSARRARRRARSRAAGGRAAGAADHAARRGPRRSPGGARRRSTSSSALLRLAREAGVPAFVLGKGSDVVVADAGIRGLVVRIRADAATIDGTTLTRRGRRVDDRARQALRGGRPRRASTGRSAFQAPSAARSGRTPAPTVARWRRSSREVEVLGADGDARAPGCRTSAASPTASRASSTATRSCSARRSSSSAASRRRSVRSSTVTRRSAGRPSRWPTRTPAASSATHPTTTPAG